jgi:hypothetical protein
MDAEYLEKILAESYKREIDQEENVVRSLPFVAAALAVLFTIVSFIKGYIPAYSAGTYAILIYALFVSFGISVASAICFLFFAVYPRRFKYLASSQELYSYVEQLRDYYAGLGSIPEEAQKAIVEDVRIFMIEQYTLGSTRNQINNVARSAARSRAFTGLVLALGLAFLIVTIISVHEAHEAMKGRASAAAVIEGE